MAKDQIYSSVIRLNTEDAQNKMEDLTDRQREGWMRNRDFPNKKKGKLHRIVIFLLYICSRNEKKGKEL